MYLVVLSVKTWQKRSKVLKLPEGIFKIVRDLKGQLGDSDSEVVRTMVISFLSEKGHLAKREAE
jgi:hypothetical protein